MSYSSISSYFAKGRKPTDATESAAESANSVESVSAKRLRSTDSSLDSQESKRMHEELEEAVKSLGENEPWWVELLFKSMDAMNDKIDGMVAKVDEFANFKSKICEKVGGLEKSVAFLSDKFDGQTLEIAALKDQVTELNKLKESHGKLLLQVDANEQHSRNECLLLHGVTEEEGEDSSAAATKFINVVKEKIGIELQPLDVKRAHRLGPAREGKTRPIIARFDRMPLRNNVFANKRKLKGTRLVISENLTKFRMGKLKEARDQYGNENVWTVEGHIKVKDETRKFFYKLA